MPITGGMRSDIRGYQAPVMHIVPHTTGISLKERFKIIQSQQPIRQEVRMLPTTGPVRGLQLALQTAGQTNDQTPRRLPVRQRLGPRPGVRVRNKHLQRTQNQGPGIGKRWTGSGIRKKKTQNRQTGVTIPFQTKSKSYFKPRVIRSAGQKKVAARAGAAAGPLNRFKWRNPDLVLSQSGGQFKKRQPRASREQLDHDLDSYMSESKAYTTW